MVHVVSDYQGEGVLIGTQHHKLWQLETSYKTGMKTITSDGTEYTFPYSVETDGTLLVPSTAKAITKVITEVEPLVGADVEMTPAESVSLALRLATTGRSKPGASSSVGTSQRSCSRNESTPTTPSRYPRRWRCN